MENFKPIKQEKVVISIRVNTDTLNYIDKISTRADISRNEFIVQSIEYALKNLKLDS